MFISSYFRLCTILLTRYVLGFTQSNACALSSFSSSFSALSLTFFDRRRCLVLCFLKKRNGFLYYLKLKYFYSCFHRLPASAVFFLPITLMNRFCAPMVVVVAVAVAMRFAAADLLCEKCVVVAAWKVTDPKTNHGNGCVGGA